MSTENLLIQLGVSLSELIASNTASYVWDRIKTLKNSKDYQKSIATYEELLSKTLEERDEAIRIARAYKREIEKIEISDDDIKHLHETISQILNTLKSLQEIQDPTGNNNSMDKTQFEIMEKLKDFISVDTLKTMQLIGFNYKTAIGEPLTEITRNFLLSKLDTSKEENALQRMLTPQLIEVLNSNVSTTNLIKLTKEWQK